MSGLTLDPGGPKQCVCHMAEKDEEDSIHAER